MYYYYAFFTFYNRMKEDLSKPLHIQLDEIQSNIKKQEEEILQLRSKIIRNDVLIKKNLSNN